MTTAVREAVREVVRLLGAGYLSEGVARVLIGALRRQLEAEELEERDFKRAAQAAMTEKPLPPSRDDPACAVACDVMLEAVPPERRGVLEGLLYLNGGTAAQGMFGE